MVFRTGNVNIITRAIGLLPVHVHLEIHFPNICKMRIACSRIRQRLNVEATPIAPMHKVNVTIRHISLIGKNLREISGSGFPQNISSHWEVRPDKYGKWKYAQLYKYDLSNWSPQSKLLRESTATLQRRFEGDSQTNSLVITSNRNCREVSKTRKEKKLPKVSKLSVYRIQ